MKDENIIQFKPVQPQEVEQKEEQPHKTLKELYGSFESIPEDESCTLDEVLEFFPVETKKGAYVVFLHEDKGIHEEMYTFDTEIQALNKYMEIKSKDKSMYLCNVEFRNVMGLIMYSMIDKLEKIK